MKIIKYCLLAAGPCLFPLSVQAQGWFIKSHIGLSQMSDLTGNGQSIAGESGRAEVALDSGFNAGLGGGYWWNDHIAMELGWEYRSNGSQTEIDGGATYPEGNYASNTFYLNGLYHFSSNGKWQPYVGAGLVWVQEVDIDLEGDGNELSYSGDGDTGYQVLAGVNYRLNQDWWLQFEGRYTSNSDLTLEAEDSSGGKFSDFDYQPVTLQVGLAYRF